VSGLIESHAQIALDVARIQGNNFRRRLDNLRLGTKRFSVSDMQVSLYGLTLSPDMIARGPSAVLSMLPQIVHNFGNSQSISPESYKFGGWDDQSWLGEDGLYAISDRGQPRDDGRSIPEMAVAEEMIELPDRWGLFVAGNVSLGERDPSDTQAGFDLTSSGVSVGVDYRFTETFIAGIGGGYTYSDADGIGHGSNSRAFNATLYGLAQPGENFYVDTFLSFGTIDFENRRTVSSRNATASSDTEALQFFGSLTLGYDFARKALNIGPYVRLNGSITEVDSFTETGADDGNITFDDQSVESLAMVLGVRADYAFSTELAIIAPHLRIEYEHEFADTSDVDVAFSNSPGTKFLIEGQSVDRNFFNIGAGISFLRPNAWSLFLDYNTRIGDSNRTYHSFTLSGSRQF
jgi:outer membrane autotransporter protein